MSGKIKILLTDGREFSIDRKLVAKDRADYYVERDADTTFQEEFDHAMSDYDEALDWLQNNMNWYELKPKLVSHCLSELSDADVESYSEA